MVVVRTGVRWRGSQRVAVAQARVAQVRVVRGRVASHVRVGVALAAALLVLCAAASIAAQSWSQSTQTSGGMLRVQELQDAWSPGNLHIGLYPLNLHWGRTANLNAGSSVTYEARRVVAFQVSGFYPYYSFDRNDRAADWFQFEAIVMLHGTSDQVQVEEFTLTSSSSSQQIGDTIYTQSSRNWVNHTARHRVRQGARLGVMLARMPVKLDGTEQAPGLTVFPTSTQLVAVAGFHTSDARDRRILVERYGVRGSTYWLDGYLDLLVGVTRTFSELTPEDDPSRLGFRAGMQQIMQRRVGLAIRAEGGLMPSRGGWYAQLGVGFGSNLWVGQEY